MRLSEWAAIGDPGRGGAAKRAAARLLDELFPGEDPEAYTVTTWEERTAVTTAWLPFEAALARMTLRWSPTVINSDPIIDVTTSPWSSVSASITVTGKMDDPPPIAVLINGVTLPATTRDDRAAIVPFFHAVAKRAR